MAKLNFDGVIEAVHYAPDGKIAWVRGYERRGPTFSDRVIFPRAGLIQRLKSGKRFAAGQRVANMSSTFDIFSPIRLIHKDGQDFVVTGDQNVSEDCLAGVPLI